MRLHPSGSLDRTAIETYMILWRLTRWIGLALVTIAIVFAGGWCAFAVWFRFDSGESVRDLLAGLIVFFAVATVVCLGTPMRWLALATYGALFAIVLLWWTTITPTNDRNWTPDVANSVTATISDDRLLVSNVRNFNWRSDTDFDERWEQRTYNLSRVSNVDLILSYWTGEAIAHLIVSFGFDDGTRLAFSIETRKERGEAYSAIAGFFKHTSWRSWRLTSATSCGCAAMFAARTCGFIACGCHRNTRSDCFAHMSRTLTISHTSRGGTTQRRAIAPHSSSGRSAPSVPAAT